MTVGLCTQASELGLGMILFYFLFFPTHSTLVFIDIFVRAVPVG